MYVERIVVDHKENRLYDCKLLAEKKGNGPHYTILIGKNGTGKSHLLAQIVECLRIHNTEECKRYRYQDFYLSLIEGKKKHEISKKNSNSQSEGNKRCVAAISFAVNDKFRFVDNSPKSGYQYLGVRSASNATFTKSLQRKLVEAIAKIFTDEKKVTLFNEFLRTIGINSPIVVTYRKRKNISSLNSLKKSLSPEVAKTLKGNSFVSVDSESDEQIERAYHTMQEYISDKYFSINFSSSSQIAINAFEILKSLTLLDKAGAIALDKIVIEKEEAINFEWASSGEQQMIYIIAHCLAFAQNDCLILIDEPETSFHPDWQMKFLPFLKFVLKPFKSVHVIISTHSHLLFSGVNPEECTVVHVRREGKCQKSETRQYAANEWSPDAVLS